MNFKTSLITEYARESDLVRTVAVKKSTYIKDFAEPVGEQLFENLKKQKGGSDQYLKDLADHFSDFYALDEESKIVNHN
jgi:hypothetical protein